MYLRYLANKILEQEVIKKQLGKLRTDKEKETQLMQQKYERDIILCYLMGMFTAGRDGKDGKGPMVQNFPLFSKGFGGLL